MRDNIRRVIHALVWWGHTFDQGDPFIAPRFGGRALVTPLRCDCGATDEMWTRIHELRGLA